MKPAKHSRLWLLLLLAIAVSINYSCNGEKLCCNKIGEDFDSPARSYCLGHAVAARMYIQEPEETEMEQERLDAFKVFFEGVKSCQTVACIVSAVDTSTVVPEFDPTFDMEHEDAEQDATVDENEKRDLIICGFEHAIESGLSD